MEAIQIAKRKKWSIDEMAEYTQKFNYILFVDSYKTQKDKLPMLCPEGHGTEISFDNFKRGKRCRDCSRAKQSAMHRKNREEIISDYESIGYKVVDGLDEYKNNSSPLLIKCNKGHEYPSNYMIFSMGSKCSKCFGKEVDLETIIQKFKDKDYTLLETDYKNSSTKLKYVCNKHPNEIQFVTWDNLKQDRACKFCGRKKTANSRKTGYNTVFDIFKEKGYELLEENYINNTTKMKYRCLKHPSETQEATLSSVVCNKNTCQFCIDEAIYLKAENSQTGISEFLRTRIGKWKIDSAKDCKYKCVIDGGEYDVIHHLYSFSSIVKETFGELGLTEFKKVKDYSDKEIAQIVSKCVEIHYRYPLGVCMSVYYHKLFHRRYGVKNNTPEQFYEFLDTVKQEMQIHNQI